MVTRFEVNYYILPIDVNAVARQNVVITTFRNVTTFWVAIPCHLTRVDVIYICFLLIYHIELYINEILISCTFIIYSIWRFHSDHIYTSWAKFIEMG